MEEKPKHSPIGASSRHRWAACPGSIKASEGIKQNPGAAAMEGTLAHDIADYALNKIKGTNLSVDPILKNLTGAVKTYCDFVQTLMAKCAASHIEHGFDISDIYPNLYGTADYVGFNEIDRVLYVVDYKHGANIVVEVKNNMQLEYYALGALHTLRYPARWVEMIIVQPRAFHAAGVIRRWRVDVLHFLDVEYKLKKEAALALSDNPPRIAGSHCLFCPAKKKCEEHKDNKGKDAQKVFAKQFGFKKKSPGEVFDEID